MNSGRSERNRKYNKGKAWMNFPELQRYFILVYNYPWERGSNTFYFATPSRL